MAYKKRKHEPRLKPSHKTARQKFAFYAIQLGALWNTVVFSDEKKFNLDGPDGWQFYWHELRREEQSFFTRQNGGGGIMIWAAFSYHGKSELRFISTTQKSGDYIYTLSEYMLPFAHLHYGLDFQFQQDNAPIHTSRETKSWLEEQGVTMLEWPSMSPDLNPIENLWGILARRVYANGRQYHSLEDLKKAIIKCWSEIDQNTLKSLVRSMPERCREVLEKKGGKTRF